MHTITIARKGDYSIIDMGYGYAVFHQQYYPSGGKSFVQQISKVYMQYWRAKKYLDSL